MIYFLFLDDERQPRAVTWVNLPPYPWTIVRSYGEFVGIVENRGLPQFVTFDHDLAEGHYADAAEVNKIGGKIDYDKLQEKTGYHAAKWLAEYCRSRGLDFPAFEVHSLNPVGAKNIREMLAGFFSGPERRI